MHVSEERNAPSPDSCATVDPRKRHTRGSATSQPDESSISASTYSALGIHTNTSTGHASRGGDWRIASVFACNAIVEPNPGKTLAHVNSCVSLEYSCLRANRTSIADGFTGSQIFIDSLQAPYEGTGALLKRASRRGSARIPPINTSITICTPATLYRNHAPASVFNQLCTLTCISRVE